MAWSLDQQIQHIEQRLASNDLPRERVELAAWAGDLASFRALGASAPEPPEDLEEWVIGFQTWGRGALVRVGLACVKLGLEIWSGSEPKVQVDRALVVVNEVKSWCRDPQNSALEAGTQDLKVPNPEEATVMLDSKMAVRGYLPRLIELADMQEAAEVAADLAGLTELLLQSRGGMAPAQATRTVHDEIAEPVVEWALGRSDPITA